MARTPSKRSPTKDTKPTIPPANAPLLTQENFEKELKDLAAKAKEETWLKWAREQSWTLLQCAALLALAAAYSTISQLTLSPIYGSIPSAIWHSKGVMTACFLGWSMNLWIKRLLPSRIKPVQLLPIIAAFVPMMQFSYFKASEFLGAYYGPRIIEAVSFFPLLALSVSCAATLLDSLEMNPGFLPSYVTDPAPGILSFAFFKTVEKFAGDWIRSTIGHSFIQTRLGLQMVMTVAYSVLAPSKMLMYMLPALLHSGVFNTHVQAPWLTNQLNSTLNEKGWSLLERQESLTGYISIIESAERGFRVMRCDHSLLGGNWIASSQSLVPEPVYGVFVMLEAVRLVEIPVPIIDSKSSALVIGLGIGTTPAALMQHGIDTTIVEIDPVVHDFATKYFALPTRHTKVIEDAVSYASKQAQAGVKYDYVVHDVFTGGAEPVDLFTYEFLQDLHKVLKPGGVIAINYAGDLLLPSARIVLATIQAIFPTCRIYRESAAPTAATLEADKRDFTNMVIFCTNVNPMEGKGLTFRKPTEKDFLRSGARKMFLMPQHEVQPVPLLKADGGLLFSNDTARFKKWQETSAMGHWAVMRTVLPKEVWEEW